MNDFKTVRIFFLFAIVLVAACSNNKTEATAGTATDTKDKAVTSSPTDAPKAKDLFPAIDLKSWKNTPVVNGRLPTREETSNGTSLLYYEHPTPDIKPYKIELPKLAYYHKEDAGKGELVVVIQVVQTKEDTMVGYRPLAGGNGASYLSEFTFLTDEEVKKVTGQ